MDSKHIEALLEKYWNAETTLDQEQELREFFQGSHVPENLNEAAMLFRYFETEKAKKLNENFDAAVTNKIRQRQGGKIVSMTNWFRVARVAAGIVVVVAAVYLIGQNVRRNSTKEIADTESDPKLAFEETKKALLMISKNFHKAQREASMINLLNEAEQTIQRKPSEKEKEQTEKKVNI
ncbi:MAG: hypothetical protein HY015_06945 [Bacteroidetes bacterium]|nr:hypothetical protein [Bacteroidota bacterium]MBI3482701.1 hypothetical protein [Bacteroidota bacterium]